MAEPKEIAQEKARQEWAPFLSKLDSTQLETLVRYRLLEPDQKTPVVTELQCRKSAFLTKASLETVKRLMALDKTKDHGWTDWIFYQAGGGTEGRQASKRGLENARVVALANSKHLPPDEAEKLWETHRVGIEELVSSGDEDVFGWVPACFGYRRDFPGELDRYAKTERAVSRFMRHLKDGIRMNKNLEAANDETVPMTPETILNPAQMEQVTAKIVRYWKSQKARTDVRVGEWPEPHQQSNAWARRKTVYDDDYVTLVVPLTYAAAVEYGSDAWDISKRELFNQALDTSTGNDPWTKGVRGKLVGFLTFNVPAPAWVSQVNDLDYRVGSLQRLMVSMDLMSGQITLYDLEGKEHTPHGVVDLLLAEPNRGEDAEAEHHPITRGANVYKTQEEAHEVVNHFSEAIQAFSRWAEQEADKADVVREPFNADKD